MKKVLSLVLVLALVLGSFSFAFAFDDTADLDCEDAVDTLVALGVINGYNDGSFKPEKVVTRAEIAKMLIVASGFEDLISGATSKFSDTVGHWADSYVAFAAGQGMVNGYPDGTFKPDAPVSYDEAITMVVRALGYTDDCLTGTWPTNYKIKALDLNLTDDVNVTAGGADRGGVATLIYNALEVNMVYIDKDGVVQDSEDNDGEKISLLDRLGKKVEDYRFSYKDIYDDDDALDTAMDLTPYIYQDVDYYENADEEVAYIAAVNVEIFKGDADSISAAAIDLTDNDAKGILKIEDADNEDDFYYANTITTTAGLFYNGAETDDLELLTGAAVSVVYFDKDEDEELDDTDLVYGIVATEETATKKIANEFDDDDLDIDGIVLPTKLDDDDETVVDYDNLTIEGDATSLEDIQEDDVVTYYAADDESGNDSTPKALRIVVSRDTIEGKVTKSDAAGDDVEVDGVAYDVSGNKLSLGDEGIFFLDKDGDIYEFDGSSANPENYAIVVGSADGNIDALGDVDTVAKVKLVTADGDEIVYDVEYDTTDDTGCKYKSSATANDVELLDANLNIVCALTPASIILYDLNNEGELDTIEIAGTEYKDAANDLDYLENIHRFTSDTLIFNYDSAKQEYSVIDYDDIDDTNNITVSAVFDDDTSFDDLDVVVLEDNTESSDTGTYAVILDVLNVYNSDDDPVKELTVFVDGVEKTYLTDDTETINITTDHAVELDINSSDEVTSVAAIAGVIADVTVAAIDVDDDAIKLEVAAGSYSNKNVESDVVVYVYDASDDEVTVGDLNDIDDNDKVTVYNVDSGETDDAGLDIIILFVD